jgi:hypothetical protein
MKNIVFLFEFQKNIPKTAIGFNFIFLNFIVQVYHLLLAIMLVGAKSSKDGRSIFQDGLWGLKFLFLLGLIVAGFFIPNSVFIPFGALHLPH